MSCLSFFAPLVFVAWAVCCGGLADSAETVYGWVSGCGSIAVSVAIAVTDL